MRGRRRLDGFTRQGIPVRARAERAVVAGRGACCARPCACAPAQPVRAHVTRLHICTACARARSRIATPPRPPTLTRPAPARSYEHSSYMDIVLSGVVGLQPAAWVRSGAAPSLAVAPLQPSDDALAWWCADAVAVGGHSVTVLWDADGSRYSRGAGLRVFVDGALAAQANTTQGPPLVVSLGA